MTKKYLCAQCLQKFAFDQAVDGFAQGYRVGFLCPYCQANLKEKNPDDTPKQQFFRLFFTLVLLFFIGIGVADQIEVFFLTGRLGVKMTLFLCFVVLYFFVFLYFKKIHSGPKGVILTQKVDN